MLQGGGRYNFDRVCYDGAVGPVFFVQFFPSRGNSASLIIVNCQEFKNKADCYQEKIEIQDNRPPKYPNEIITDWLKEVAQNADRQRDWKRFDNKVL